MGTITVRAAGDRLTREEKITPLLERDQTAGEPSRLRIPLDIYDRSDRGYVRVPEAAWNVEITGLDVAGVEEFIRRLSLAITEVAKAMSPAAGAETGEVKP